MKKPSILITSVGSRAAEGILACLAPVRDRIRVIATNSVADAPGLYDADVAYLVPPTAHEVAFAQRMTEIAGLEAPDLVVNGRDEEVVMLAHLFAHEPLDQPVFLGPRPGLAPIFNDKYQTAAFAREHGLPFVATAFAEAEVRLLLATSGLPVVAKPRAGGHASRDVYVLTTPEQVEAALQHGGFVFQAFVGEGRLGDSFRSWNTRLGIPWMWNPPQLVPHAGCGHRSQWRGGGGMCVEGRARRQRGAAPATARHARSACAGASPCAGSGRGGAPWAVNIQGVVLPDGSFVAFEWNARFVGSTPGYALLGQNQVVAALRHFLPALSDLPDPASSRATVFRPLVFRGVPNDAIELLRENGQWQLEARVR
ncbi:MAG: hypothetical protein IPF55_19300 [Rhodoferax sp.]|nr:hypothetical protein [Rhodoferax sp.]